MPPIPEQLARSQIDAQLSACGWLVQDYKAVDFSAGRGIVLREVSLTTGPCDYLLFVDRHAVGVIEAKKEGTTLSAVADQSERYANSLPDFLAAGSTETLPFLYESTGVETFFRDTRDPDPRSRRVFTFHRPETLADWFPGSAGVPPAVPDVSPDTSELPTLRARLKAMPTAHPLVDSGNDAANSGTGAPPGMRDCQIEAITGLENSFAENRPRALIHMATGSGKTYTACAFTSTADLPDRGAPRQLSRCANARDGVCFVRLIKHAGARRILFLVDRANLGEQARDGSGTRQRRRPPRQRRARRASARARQFHRFRTPDTGRLFTELYNVQHLTSPHLDDVCRVTICTIQRLYSILRGEELAEGADDLSGAELAAALGSTRTRDIAYNPAVPIEKFDFIVTDECHRSIYNLWRQVGDQLPKLLEELNETLAA